MPDSDIVEFELTLEGEGQPPEFRLGTLRKTLEDLEKLLHEVESELGIEPIQWNYDAEPIVRVTAHVNGVDHASLTKVVTMAHSGFKAESDHGASGHSGVTTQVRQQARRILKRLRGFADVEIIVSGQEAIHVDKDFDLGPRSQVLSLMEFSELDGVLDVINVHGNPHFVVYEHGTANRVHCSMKDDCFKEAKENLGLRVIVEGKIRYRNGIPRRVSDVTSVRPVPAPGSAIEDLRGAMGNITGGMESGEFVRRIREEEEE